MCMPLFTNYQIKIYDSSDNLVHTIVFDSNLACYNYFNETGVSQTFTVKVLQRQSFVGSYSNAVSLSVLIHNHEYNHHFVKNNELTHKSYCECGEYALQTHDVTIVIPNVLGRCTLCNQIIDLTSVPIVNDIVDIE